MNHDHLLWTLSLIFLVLLARAQQMPLVVDDKVDNQSVVWVTD